jgi:hypothetical protein
MHNARFRVMAGLAGATLCLFAVTSYAQNTDPATTSAPTTQTPAAQPSTPTGDASTPAPVDQGATTQGTITTTGSQTSTETTTTSFPGGVWGIIAVAAVILLVLFGLFRGKDKTIVKDTYVNNPPVTRTSSTGTANERVVTSRAASPSGTTETTTRTTNDPNTRS